VIEIARLPNFKENLKIGKKEETYLPKVKCLFKNCG